MSESSNDDYGRFLTDTKKQLRKLEADLLDQGIKFYPGTKAGDRARTLWLLIKLRLLRGVPIRITISALGLDWHREELKRARSILVEMELIKRRDDGGYVLGPLGPYSRIDEVIREEFFVLKLLEDAVIAVCSITKSKTREEARPSQASHRRGCNDNPSSNARDRRECPRRDHEWNRYFCSVGEAK
jgi:hypothetical protein